MILRWVMLPALACVAQASDLATAEQQSFGPIPKLDLQRVGEISAALPKSPAVPGRPVSDRTAWEEASHLPVVRAAVTWARSEKTKIPPVLDASFQAEYEATGSRKRYDEAMEWRRSRLTAFAVAEGAERQGEFLPLLVEELDLVLAEPSWAMPAHLSHLPEAERENYLDLLSTELAFSLAVMDGWFGDLLGDARRKRIRDAVWRRVLGPYLKQAEEGQARYFWMTASHNWNAVCHAGVVGAALGLVPDVQMRAQIVAMAESLLPRYFEGFANDGLCLEGVRYWNYGFGAYLLIAEALYEQTGGRVNWYADRRLDVIGRAGPALEIVHGRYAPFSDTGLDSRIQPQLVALVNRRLFGNTPASVPLWASWDPSMQDGKASPIGRRLWEAALGIFPAGGAVRATGVQEERTESRTRSFFPDGGVLVWRCEDTTDQGRSWGVAIKGGHNGEPHNHLDLGSYAVVSGSSWVFMDPGGERYNAQTFSDRRYESMFHNAFGHPVPIVAGRGQIIGAKARARFVATTFTGPVEEAVLDLTEAYDEPALKRLTRTFRFDGKGRTLTIEDEAEFSDPRSFSLAFIVPAEPMMLRPDGFQPAGATVTVVTSSEFCWESRPVIGFENPPGVNPIRIGLNFERPHTRFRCVTSMVFGSD